MHTDAPLDQPELEPPSRWLLMLAFIGFVSLGLPDAAIGIAWPSVREIYHLRQPALGLVFAMLGLGYLMSSFSYGRISRHMGIGSVLTGSTVLVAIAMFGFALAPWWALFVLCSGLHGLGSGAIDSGLNFYAAHHLPTRHLIWLHACYCAGAMLGPVVMTAVFVSGQTYQQGYFIIGASMGVMSLLFLMTRKQWGRAEIPATSSPSKVNLSTALQHPLVRLQMAVFFLYAGLEVACSQWTFTILTESRGVSPVMASTAVAIFWSGLLCGRVLFGVWVDRIGPDRLVRCALLSAVVGGGLFALPLLPIGLSLAGLCLVGWGLAPVFPCLISRTPKRVGIDLSAQAIGLQVGASMIGAAAVPGALGLIAGRWGIATVSFGISILLTVLFILHEILLRRADSEKTTNNNIGVETV